MGFGAPLHTLVRVPVLVLSWPLLSVMGVGVSVFCDIYLWQSGCFLNVFLLVKLSLFLVRENRLLLAFVCLFVCLLLLKFPGC